MQCSLMQKLNIRNCFISKQVIRSLGSMVSQGFLFAHFQEEGRWESEVNERTADHPLYYILHDELSADLGK